jgi:hypothetical protein
MPEPPRLLDRVRAAVRTRHYSRRTEEAYLGWTKRFILFHPKCHPAAMGADEVNAFLSHLAVVGKVSASTQAQALSALVFLYGMFSTIRCRGSTTSFGHGGQGSFPSF